MLTNIIFLAVGVFVTVWAFIILDRLTGIRNKPVGELQVDTEKEIVQLVFYSTQDLHLSIHDKTRVTFDVVHKSLDFKIPEEFTQGKQSL